MIEDCYPARHDSVFERQAVLDLVERIGAQDLPPCGQHL
jgi:hypothetical protein